MAEKEVFKSKPGGIHGRRTNKAMMTRSRLRNKYLKKKSGDSNIVYDNERNYCLNLFVGPKTIISLKSTSVL